MHVKSTKPVVRRNRKVRWIKLNCAIEGETWDIRLVGLQEMTVRRSDQGTMNK